jgi:dTDP-4-amino-4,6-dideoxygalactose transaminase
MSVQVLSGVAPGQEKKRLAVASVTAMPVLAPGDLFSRSLPIPWAPSERPASYWYSGRTALWQAAKALGLNRGDRVLAPAYSCGSEVDALLKAGLVVDYYPVTRDLRPDFDRVEAASATPARALLVTHYFGFPQAMPEVLAFARSRGLLVIEDNAHGLFSSDGAGRALGTFGDVGVFSLAKTLPLPDGGALIVNAPDTTPAGDLGGTPPDVLPVAGKLRFLVERALASRLPRATALFKKRASDPVVAALKSLLGAARAPASSPAGAEREEKRLMELKAERVSWRMSRVSRLLFRRLARPEVREIRRRNFEDLGRRLLDRGAVVPLLPGLPPGCCPLFFPVVVEDPVGLQRHLAAHGVGTKHFWSFFHPAIPMERFPFESRLKRTVVVLPVHQDLGEDEVAYLADRVNAWNP